MILDIGTNQMPLFASTKLRSGKIDQPIITPLPIAETVTRWLNYFSISDRFPQQKYAQSNYSFAKVGLNFPSTTELAFRC